MQNPPRRPGSRRATSLIEVMVALAIVSLLLVPLLSLMRPGAVEVSARMSAASYLLGRLLENVRHMPYVRLQEFLAKSPDAVHGYRQVDLSNLVAPSQAAAGGLDVKELVLFVRATPHVAGQFGLDRVDLKLGYGTGDAQRWMTRSFVRRNARELNAMSRLRLYRPTEDLSDEQVRTAVRSIAKQTAQTLMAQRKKGSPFLVPVYPGILRNFEGFDSDPAAAEEAYRGEGLGGADGNGTISWGDALAEGGAPRPRFGATAGICD